MKAVKIVPKGRSNQFDRIDARDLRNELNKMDESMGLFLDNMENIDFAKRYKKLKNIVKKYLAFTIVSVAKLPADEFFKKKGKHYKLKRELSEDVLKDNSPLFALNRRGVTLKSKIFRKQYYCILATYILNYLDEIIEGQVLTNDTALSETESKIMYLTELITELVSFTTRFFEDVNYSDALLNLYTFITTRTYKGKVDQASEFATISAKKASHIIKSAYIADGIAANEIIKLAIILGTDNYKISNKVLVDLDADAESDHISDMIESLGYLVVKSWDEDGRPMFVNAFMKCCPLMCYKFKDVNRSINVNYGCKMLTFVDFMMGDRIVHHFINRMVRKPMFGGIFGQVFI